MRSLGPGCTAAALWLLIGILSPAHAQSSQSSVAGTANPQTESQQQKPPLKKPSHEPSAPGEREAPAADDEATIKVETTLVAIPVSVLDRNGRYIPHLTKRDFHVYEDGVEQEIAEFTSVEEPFHVVLLLDTSGSTRFKIDEIQRAAIAFIEELKPRDQVMIVSFDNQVYIDSEFTDDRARLRRAIYRTRTGGATKLYDAVDLVITERLDHVQGRKAIVLFTDGVDTSSRLASARSSLERVEESGALVYPIQYDTEEDTTIFGRRGGNLPPPIIDPWPLPRSPRSGRRRWPFDSLVNPQFPRGGRGGPEVYERASRYLRDLAERSGARLYHADTIGNLPQAFSLVAEELRHQYALSYYPTNTARDGTYRRIRVRVNQPDLAVRARAGYRAASNAPPSDAPSRDRQARPE